jgi:hypothetical protein
MMTKTVTTAMLRIWRVVVPLLMLSCMTQQPQQQQ